jgi:phosphatidylinositol dimannoside acyltransferase
VAGLGSWATARGYGAAWSLVRRLPERAAYRLGDVIADRVTVGNGKGVQRLRANLRRAVPDDREALEAAVRAGIRSYVRYWFDAFRLPTWSAARVVSSVRTVGQPAVAATLAQGRGVVCALAHLGNWDHAGAWSCRELARVVTVAERLQPEDLYDRFVAFRSGLGMEILPLTGGQPPLPVLAERLRAGGFAPLLADRDLTGRGVAVDLLGEPALVASGPAVLAARTGSALHAVTITYEPRPEIRSGWGLVIEFHPEISVARDAPDDVAAAVQAYADAWSGAIRAHPQDWHMLQRVFRADLSPR